MSVNPIRKTAELRSGDPIELSVIIPTLNEAGNIHALLARLESTLSGIAWEAIFVDDNSPDGTAQIVKELAVKDHRIRCIHRIGRRGLAGACIEGMLLSSAPYVAVMDGDLQHDETLLPKMYARLFSGEADLVVGSRYMEGGSAEGLDRGRGVVSRTANGLAQRLLGTKLNDPMSGFFMIRRDRIDAMADRLSTSGFKILLDIVMSGNGELRIAEEPYSFRTRTAGESKFDTRAGIEFLGLMLSKCTGGVLSTRFLIYGLVGTVGLGIHLAILRFSLDHMLLGFPVAQSAATLAAMGSNFILNNAITYRDQRLKGFAMIGGFVGFCLIGSAGAITNIGMASWLYSEHSVWWLAGAVGAIMGALWNYSMSGQFVWRAR